MKISSVNERGLTRENNQDVVFSDKIGVFGVADGMGGLEDGARAANCVISHLSEASKTIKEVAKNSVDDLVVLNTLEQTIRKADQEIVRLTKKERKISGSTALFWTIAYNKLFVSWVGDSYLYLLSENEIFRLTSDHTVAELKRSTGKGHIVLPRDEHTLTRCVGAGLENGPDSRTFTLPTGHWALLGCTDGFNLVESNEVLRAYNTANSVDDWLSDISRIVLARGATDNYSAVGVWSN